MEVLGRWWRGRAFGREDPKDADGREEGADGAVFDLFIERLVTNPARFFENGALRPTTSLLGASNEV